MKSKYLLLSLLLGLSLNPAMPAAALPAPSLMMDLARKTPPPPFYGQREIKVVRQNNVNATKISIQYGDEENYDLVVNEPGSINGLRFNIVDGVTSAYFPSEKQVFDSFAFRPVARTLLNQLSGRQELIGANYDLRLLNKDTVVNNVHTYVIDFIPKNLSYDKDGKTLVAGTPRRRYWLEQNSLQVMREERYWDWVNSDRSWNFNPTPFFISAFSNYVPAAQPNVPELDASGAKAYHLSAQSGKWLSYTNPKDAQSHEGVNVVLPGYLPKGFMLVDMQILTLAGAKVQLQNYTDGVNDLMIAVLPQSQLGAVLTNGLSFSMVQKLGTLSLQTPFNYIDASNGKNLIEVFGDIHPAELERVGANLKS